MTQGTIEPTEAETAALAHAITRASGIARDETDRAPIVAAILVDDEVIAWGDNKVHVENDPSRHAEIVAISRACAERGTPSLQGASIVTTLQPCEMCLGAIRMSGIARVIFAAGRPGLKDGYFAFPGLALEQFVEADPEGFGWAGHVMEADVMALYGKREG